MQSAQCLVYSRSVINGAECRWCWEVADSGSEASPRLHLGLVPVSDSLRVGQWWGSPRPWEGGAAVSCNKPELREGPLTLRNRGAVWRKCGFEGRMTGILILEPSLPGWWMTILLSLWYFGIDVHSETGHEIHPWRMLIFALRFHSFPFSFFPVFLKSKLDLRSLWMWCELCSVMRYCQERLPLSPTPAANPAHPCEVSAFESVMLGKANKWRFYLISLITA